MDANFNHSNAKECDRIVNELLSNIAAVESLCSGYKKKSTDTFDELVTRECHKFLQTVDIRDFHSERWHLSTNALERAGIRNVDQLFSISEAQLATLNSMTLSAAHAIENQWNSMVAHICKKIQIDLAGSDDQDVKDHFLNEICKYQMSLPIQKELGEFVIKNNVSLNAALADLSPRKSRLTWLFSSSSTKKNAENAYQYLYQFFSGPEYQRTQQLLEQIQNVDRFSTEDARSQYQAAPAVIEPTLEFLYPERFGIENRHAPYDLGRANSLASYFDYLINGIEICKQNEETYRTRILSAGQKVIAKESMEILKSIPVEEVNRDKRGFRVNALRTDGYETILDVYTASPWDLAAVRGVSEDSAMQIKAVARTIAEESNKSVKIKLNLDNKNAESSELVQSIAMYRQNQEVRKACDAIRKKISRIRELNQSLQQGGDAVSWYLLSNESRRQAGAAFHALQDIQQDAAVRDASKGITNLYKISGIDVNAAWYDFSKNPVQFYNILEDIMPGVLGNGDSVYGLPEDLAKAIQDECIFPDGLLCTLRRYQEWGVKYILHQERVLLGDEMGLGKTVQAIASMVSLKNTGASHFVVVCPASVLSNWCREIRRHSKLSVVKVHGADRRRAFIQWLGKGGVAVTTYETTGFFEFPADFRFSELVVDEAHYIKNPEAKRSQNVRAIANHAERMLFMTGTALENKVEEMIALIDILQPAIGAEVKNMVHLNRAPQFREKVAPVYYRRKREDVLTELPELIANEEWCSLSGVEEAIYEDAVLAHQTAQARRVSWNVDDLADSSKARRLREIVAEAKEDDRKVIVFSFFLDTIRKIYDYLGPICMDPINGSVSPTRRQEIIDQFEDAAPGSVLLAQIQAGGTGLNIQAASVVVICEPQFKPSIENQAISRAYRMGQTRNVLVYRLLCDDTIDERIMEILHKKQVAFDAFADESVAANKSFELDDKTFGSLIQEEIDRINAKKSA